MKIHVRNLEAAQEFTSDPEKFAVISVVSPGHKGDLPMFLEPCVAILRQQFHDIDLTIFPNAKSYRCFNDVDASEIKGFVDGLVAQKIPNLLVHCEAGISRSPAIAAAVAFYLEQPNFDYFKRYIPNLHVFNTLLKAFQPTARDSEEGKP